MSSDIGIWQHLLPVSVLILVNSKPAYSICSVIVILQCLLAVSVQQFFFILGCFLAVSVLLLVYYNACYQYLFWYCYIKILAHRTCMQGAEGCGPGKAEKKSHNCFVIGWIPVLKSFLRETPNLSTDADSSTNICVFAGLKNGATSIFSPNKWCSTLHSRIFPAWSLKNKGVLWIKLVDHQRMEP